MAAKMDILQAQAPAGNGEKRENTSEFHLEVAKEGANLNCLLATVIRQSEQKTVSEGFKV